MAFTDDPYFTAWLESAGREMLPMMESSAISLAIFTGKIDAKLCLEIGAAILYDKPIVLIAYPDTVVPTNLERCADRIVRGDPRDEDTRKRLQIAVEGALRRGERRGENADRTK